jgi:lysophospholipase L1-like esterase
VHKVRKIGLILLFNILVIVGVVFAFDFMFSPYRRLPKDGVFGGEQYTWGNLVETNRFGFRERDFAIPKPDGVFRVMVLGDSFTWGEGLAVEKRYTAIAEDLLNKNVTEMEFEVLNFGVRGASTVQEKNLLRKYLKDVQPDLIVVAFGLNDTQPRDMNYSVERARVGRQGGELVRKFSKVLYNIGLRFTAESLYNAFYAVFERSGTIPTWQMALDRTYKESSQEWQDFLQALSAIKEMSDRKGLPGPIFAVLEQGTTTTEATDFGKPDEKLELYLRWYRQAETAAQGAGYIVYNHKKEIAERLNDQPLSINALDPHPSAALNQIYGEKLYQAIIDLLEIETGSSQ